MASVYGLAYGLACQLPHPEALPDSPAAARVAIERVDALMRPFSPRDVDAERMDVPGEQGPIGILVQRRRGGGPAAPVVVFLHGGGYMCGSTRSHQVLTARIASVTGAVVVSADYRLAPEHPYPAAYDDALAVLAWVAQAPPELEADTTRRALAGDSAGAALAVGTAVAARDRGIDVAGVLSLYGWFDFTLATPQFLRRGPRDVVIPAATMHAFAEAACHAPGFLDDDYDLGGLAPVHLIVGDRDPLADDSRLLAARLVAAGVETDLRTYVGMPHGFCSLWPLVPPARRALRRGTEFLTSVLQR